MYRLCLEAVLVVPRNVAPVSYKRWVHRRFSSPTVGCGVLVPKARLKIQVTPKSALSDDDTLQIAVTGLRRQEPVTLHTSVKENDVMFAAVGHYATDDSGYLDTLKDTSTGGNFVGVEPLGLLWAMGQVPGQRAGLYFTKKDVTTPFKISLAVHRSHLGLEDLHKGDAQLAPLCTISLERSYMTQGVQRIPVTHGKVRGMLFLPEGRGPFPGVIDMFGSSGGILEMRSALLASRGIVALALPYIKYKDLPKTYKELHVDYFEEATKYLSSHPSVIKDRGIGVVGISKGGDIALAMAEFIPTVRAVVCINAFCYSWESDLKYKGIVVKRGVRGDMEKCSFQENNTVICGVNATPVEVEEGRMLHIEKSDASFLFITGLDDQCVSPAASSVAPNRLRKHGKTNFEHITYPGAGHSIGPPYNPHVFNIFHRFSSGDILIRLGGERRAHAHAQVDAWKRVLTFFKEKLM